MQETFPDGALYFHWGWPGGNEEGHDRWYIEHFEEIATGMKCLHDEYQSQKGTMVRTCRTCTLLLLLLFRGQRVLMKWRCVGMLWGVPQLPIIRLRSSLLGSLP